MNLGTLMSRVSSLEGAPRHEAGLVTRPEGQGAELGSALMASGFQRKALRGIIVVIYIFQRSLWLVDGLFRGQV